MACPFMAAGAAGAAPADDAAKCPFLSGGAPTAAATAAPAAAPGPADAVAPVAVCPLGFGTSRGPRLSSLHCPVCRGLLHEAHSATQCKHTFCQACISKARDCPVCGSDITSSEPNPELAGRARAQQPCKGSTRDLCCGSCSGPNRAAMDAAAAAAAACSGLVDTFLETHSRSPELVAAQSDLGPLPDNSPASFFMAQGLKSLSGGNVHAALHRLNRCRDALLAAQAAAAAAAESPADPGDGSAPAAPAAPEAAALKGGGGTPQQQPQQARLSGAAAACQLAACCGCLGDCHLRLGDPGSAEALYQEAIESVAAFSEADAEAAHAMSVSLNKLGDLRYLRQDLPGAKEQYRAALQLRQLCCGPLSGGQAGPGQQLELASCLIKLADACKALGDTDEGEQLLRTAQGVCFEVQLQEADLPAAVARKLQLLLGVLHAQTGSAE